MVVLGWRRIRKGALFHVSLRSRGEKPLAGLAGCPALIHILASASAHSAPLKGSRRRVGTSSMPVIPYIHNVLYISRQVHVPIGACLFTAPCLPLPVGYVCVCLLCPENALELTHCCCSQADSISVRPPPAPSPYPFRRLLWARRPRSLQSRERKLDLAFATLPAAAKAYSIPTS